VDTSIHILCLSCTFGQGEGINEKEKKRAEMEMNERNLRAQKEEREKQEREKKNRGKQIILYPLFYIRCNVKIERTVLCVYFTVVTLSLYLCLCMQSC